MKRRELLAGMLGLGAVAVARSGLARTNQPKGLWLQDTRIAGSHYYRFAEAAPVIRQGDALRLRRQPDNRYDENAVEVFWQDKKLGYLPRVENAAVTSLLSRGHKLEARVLEVMDPAEAWEPMRMRVWVEPAQ